jgi:hypothetical protein
MGPRRVLDTKTYWLTDRQSQYDLDLDLVYSQTCPCGGGVEYLHRDPASRRRLWKRKSQIWHSKMWSRVPRDSGPEKTALASTSIIHKRQTRPLVREGAPQKQDRNCQKVINIWSWAPDGARHQDWLMVSRNVTLTFLQSVVASHSKEPVCQGHAAVMERTCEDSAVKC